MLNSFTDATKHYEETIIGIAKTRNCYVVILRDMSKPNYAAFHVDRITGNYSYERIATSTTRVNAIDVFTKELEA